MPNLFVIIPVYNAVKTIENTVNSLLLHKECALTIILVDDGSTDNSPVLCNCYEEMYKNLIYIHKENEGVSKARNTGLEWVYQHSKSDDDYIAFLDADDWWCENVNIDTYLYRAADLIAFSSLKSNESGNRFLVFHQYEDKEQFNRYNNLEWVTHGHFGSFLYKKSLLKNNKIYFDEKADRNEDLVFWHEAAFAAKSIIFSHEYIYIYRVNSASVTHTNTHCMYFMGLPDIWINAAKWAKSNEEFDLKQIDTWNKFCLKYAGSVTFEVLCILVEEGWSISSIYEKFLTGTKKECFEALNIEDYADWLKPDFQLFTTKPILFEIKLKIHGLIKNIVSRFKRWSICKKVYDYCCFKLTYIP